MIRGHPALSGNVGEHRFISLVVAAHTASWSAGSHDLTADRRVFQHPVKSYRVFPGRHPGRINLVEAMFSFYRGDYSEAIELAKKSQVLLGTSDLTTVNLIGNALLKLGNFSHAESFIKAAAVLAPGNVERLCGLAQAQMCQGRLEEATKTLDEAKAIDEGSHEVTTVAIQLAINKSDLSEAKRLIESVSNHEGVISNLNIQAVATILTGAVERGIKLYEDLLESIPEYLPHCLDVVQYNTALAFVRAGQPARSLLHLSSIRESGDPKVVAKGKSLLQRVKAAVKTRSEVSLR